MKVWSILRIRWRVGWPVYIGTLRRYMGRATASYQRYQPRWDNCWTQKRRKCRASLRWCMPFWRSRCYPTRWHYSTAPSKVFRRSSAVWPLSMPPAWTIVVVVVVVATTLRADLVAPIPAILLRLLLPSRPPLDASSCRLSSPSCLLKCCLELLL